MKYIVETKFVVHERQYDIKDDSPVRGESQDILRKHITYGTFKTRRGAENTLNRGKKYWRKQGYKHPPKKAPAYDPEGNFMFSTGHVRSPEEIRFFIEEKEISRKKTR